MKDYIYRIEIDPCPMSPKEEFDNYSDYEQIAYADGEVYGWIVEEVTVVDDELASEHVDSCWGYYGEEGRKLAIETAKEVIADLKRLEE